MADITIDTKDLSSAAGKLRAGDRIRLNGTVYTARDAAHKRIKKLIEEGGRLPFDLKGAAIYYAGPTPAKGGMPIGSCGPTTSGRMDPYTPMLMDMGLAATIGKGDRSPAVYDAIVRNGALYLCAIGGAGALYAGRVEQCEVIAFDDLGCESVKRLRVKDFPLIVGIDTAGGSLFR